MAKKIFVAPHFHYDLAWLLTEQLYLKRVYSIIEKVLDIMDTDDQFKYLFDQTYYLEKLKVEKPVLFKQVAERVAQGRIEIVNGGYTMPDLNLVSPDTLRKAYLLANKFAKDEFGVEPKVAWMIDCFGSPGLMPKIAREAGLEYYVFWRGMNKTGSTQDFIWRGTDGSTLITHWLKRSYSFYGLWGKDLRVAIKKCKPTTDYVFIPFGGDFYKPEKRLIKQVHNTKEAQFATPSEFFKKLEGVKDKLPVIEGEFLSNQKNFRGVYSSRVRYKQLYRRAEKKLLEQGGSEDDWKDLMYGTFHDLISGTGLDVVYPAAEQKLKRLEAELYENKRPVGNVYRGKFLNNLSLKLRFDAGDLYHTRPFGRAMQFKPTEFKAHLDEEQKLLELDIGLDFMHPHTALQLAIKTGINNGEVYHRLEKDLFVRKKLDTLYAFNDFFEYWDKDRKDGIRLYSDDCFAYKVNTSGVIYLTLVRGVMSLNWGDAAPPIPCPKALEFGHHKFKIKVSGLGQKNWF